MFQSLTQKCNYTRLRKAHNFEKIVIRPGRFFSVLKRIFPPKKVGTRKQRRFWRFSYEKKFKRLTAGAKAYTRKAKLKQFIWDHKYGATTSLKKNLLVPSWAQKLPRKRKQYNQSVNVLNLRSNSSTITLPKKWSNLLGRTSLPQKSKASSLFSFQKNKVLRKKLALWKHTVAARPLSTKKVYWQLFLAKWRKKAVSSSKSGEQQKLTALKKTLFTKNNKTLIDWSLWSKIGQKGRETVNVLEPGKAHLRRLSYVKLGKRWKRKLRFWKYRRSRWKRFEHYRRFSVWRWNNLGKWASFQLYPYKIYRRIHQPFRFTKAKQLKKNRWFRILNKGYEQGFAINRQVRLRNQQQYTKRYSFFYGFARPKQIMERSRHFLHLKGSGPQKRNIWLSWLERRLDVVLCRMRLAPSITVARVLITRGYIWVNKKQEMNPQKRVQLWDIVEINKNDLSFLRFWYLRNRFQRHAYKYRNLRYRFFHSQKAALPFGFMIKNPFASDIPKKDLTSVAEVERLFLLR